jgi:hypothetical protein
VREKRKVNFIAASGELLRSSNFKYKNCSDAPSVFRRGLLVTKTGIRYRHAAPSDFADPQMTIEIHGTALRQLA